MMSRALANIALSMAGSVAVAAAVGLAVVGSASGRAAGQVTPVREFITPAQRLVVIVEDGPDAAPGRARSRAREGAAGGARENGADGAPAWREKTGGGSGSGAAAPGNPDGAATGSVDGVPEGVLTLRLFVPAAPPVVPGPEDALRPIAQAPVQAGRVDLGELFAAVLAWPPGGAGDGAGEGGGARDVAVKDRPRVVYVQLFRGERPVHAPLILVAMTTPMRGTPLDRQGLSVRFLPMGPAYFAGYRAFVDRHVVIDTNLGVMEFRLRPDAAPNTLRHFASLVEGGLYDGLTFHRVVGPGEPGKGFMVQGGDPLGTGAGGPGFAVVLENSSLPHDFGVLSLARLAGPDTAGSQFFITLARQTSATLDGSYAAFGQLVRGEETLRAIARVPVEPGDRPINPVVIRQVRMVPAPAWGMESQGARAGAGIGTDGAAKGAADR